MNYNDIKELIGIIDSSKLTNFELSMDNVNVKMSKTGKEFAPSDLVPPVAPAPQMPVAPQPTASVVNSTPSTVAPQGETVTEEEKAPEISGNIVKSPIVGTFYSSTSPGKPPIVSKGDKVSKGDVLCIVEAMKVMNEITSDFDGEVLEIFVENGQLVEFGEPLFAIG